MKQLFFLGLFLFCVSLPGLSHANQSERAGVPNSETKAQDNRLTIAILEFEAVNEEAKKSNKGRMVSEMLTTEAFSTGQFNVVERHQIKKILDEMEFGDAAFSGGTAQKIGELLGADAVLTGSVSEFLGVLRVDARLINVKDGRILLADSAQTKLTMQAMSQAVRDIMVQMLSALGGQASPRPVAASPAPSGEPRLLRPAAIKASSSLKPSRYADYQPGNLLDGNPESVWVEGAKGNGTGEWLELSFDRPRLVSKLGFMNGYNKIAAKDGSDRWRQNSRVKTIRITFASGQSLEHTLTDTRQWQYASFAPVRTDRVRITLLQNYPGSKWPNDTCLSEIRVYGQ